MKTLDDILTGYPSFQPNQLLSSEDLNSLSGYLEQQDRLTRQRLIGVGVACGLVPDRGVGSEGPMVTVHRGVGVTSQGYLAYLDTTDRTHRRPFTNEAGYQPLEGASTPILELLEDPGETNDDTIEVLAPGDLANRVVVLYLEKRERETDQCLDDDCDEKGKRWEIVPRLLLVAEADLDDLILEEEAGRGVAERRHPAFSLPTVAVERFGYRPAAEMIDLASVDSLEAFREAYRGPIRRSGLAVAQALHEAYRLFGPLFRSQLGTSAHPFPGFDGEAGSNPFVQELMGRLDEDALAAQYVYGHVRDLATAYDELRDALFELSGRCCPPTGWFPCHLMLGSPVERRFGAFEPDTFDPPDPYRHSFVPSPIHDGQSGLLARVRLLAQRLVLLRKSFALEERLPPDEGVRVTPSRPCREPLGRRAIPFYYDVAVGERPLYRHWSFEASLRGRSDELLGYHALDYVKAAAPAVTTPLRFDLCTHDALRIEGHVGMRLGRAVAALQAQRERYNLDFDILTLKLDPTFDSVHLADDTKIADLQSRYLTERNELVCCVRDAIRELEEDRDTAQFAVSLYLYLLQASRGSSTDTTTLMRFFVTYYQLYIDTLKDLVRQLPPDLKDFDLMEFQEAYELAHAMTAFGKYVINTLGDVDLIGDSDVANARLFKAIAVAILNQFELYVDRLLDDCVLTRFLTIHELFVDRVRTTALFAAFNEAVHGMEHLAGSRRGGTFVLVYDDPAEVRDVVGRVVDMEGNPLRGARVRAKEATRGATAVTGEDGRFQLRMAESQDTLRFKRNGYYTKDATIGKKNEVEIKLKSYSEVQKDRNRKDFLRDARSTSDRGDRQVAFNAVVSGMGEAGLTSASALEAKLEKQRIVVDREIIFVDDENFRVVGDFYLPFTLPSYELEAELTEACALEGRAKAMDVERAVEEVRKKMMDEKDLTGFDPTTGSG